MKSCYIHIPFCNNICSYCDFCKMYYDSNLVDKYLDELEKEINSIYKNEELDTIYIGGGTPSCLNINQLERLFKITDRLNKSKDIEFTIEGNFESTNYDKLSLYKKHGVNRLSFGLESINKDNLKFLNRENNLEQIENIINISRELGFNNINIDLIYAIPNEDLKILEDDLDYILNLDVEHISTYSLIIEDNTMLSINKTTNIDEDIDYEMYKFICNKLNSYKHYEISNFSKEGYYSKHNLCYWNNSNYYGFGLGAASYIGNMRITNTRSINKYLEGKYIMDEEVLSKEEIMEYEIILNLRKSEGISLSNFKNKFKIDFLTKYNIDELINNKLLVFDNDNIYIPEDKMYLNNEIIIRVLGSDNNG